MEDSFTMDAGEWWALRTPEEQERLIAELRRARTITVTSGRDNAFTPTMTISFTLRPRDLTNHDREPGERGTITLGPNWDDVEKEA